MSNYYPIYVDVENKPILIIGGGSIALRKVETLLEYGALIKIISPRIIPELQDRVNKKQCEWIPREYSSEDIEDSFLVFSCTEKEEVNARVAQDVQDSSRLINVVDDPDKCSFIVPSTMRRGDLSIAVSTSGSSPMVARQIREELEGFYGDEIRVYLNLLKTWRKEIKQHLPPEKRQQFWHKVTDGEVLNFIKQGQQDQAKEVIANCFRLLLD
ncbi:MAG: precorrin-2 oxidase [Gracilibacter sp. BRH_c7a]|nr:MAG: precorrin-2 oxidase [Gracilibacter sp. BRH_c7a]